MAEIIENSLTTKLAEAWERRKDFIAQLQAEDTNAYRAFGGDREGIDGLEIECFDSVIIFSVYENRFDSRQSLLSLAKWYLNNVPGIRSVYVKKYVVDRSNQLAEAPTYSPTPLAGEEAPSEILIKEFGNQFLIRPYAGYSVGIFLDQRLNRRYLSSLLPSGLVLNCFAYTGAFSVFCAKAGLKTLSVDLSSKYLNWARFNFEVNELDQNEHEFVAADVFDYLFRAVRQSRKFDLVILDPPSFSRNKKGRVFSVQKDFERLLIAASEVLNPHGKLFFSSNFSKWSSTDLIERARMVLDGFHFEQTPPPPFDFKWQKNKLSSFLAYLD